MLPICVRPERVWPQLSSIQGIKANLVYVVSLKISKYGVFRYSLDIRCKTNYEENLFVCLKGRNDLCLTNQICIFKENYRLYTELCGTIVQTNAVMFSLTCSHFLQRPHRHHLVRQTHKSCASNERISLCANIRYVSCAYYIVCYGTEDAISW